tara:strand:- start:384 stop:1607 length:1224 start_codon:yes stop_codon:yes gene_type:complete
MKITKVETIYVDEFWQMCWVRIHTDSGKIGLGETWYLPKSVSAVIHEIYAPSIIGKNPMDREDIWDKLFKLSGIFTYSGAELRALSAIDIALWDLTGQELGQPIYNLLGGKVRDKIKIYNTVGSYGKWQDNEFEKKDPVGFLMSLLDEGIDVVKAYYLNDYAEASGGNFISSKEIKEALEPLKKQRKALGDQIEIAHDGSGQWALAPAIKIGKAMDEYNIFWQEEMIHPLNAKSHLKLASEINSPVCAAERLMTRYEFREYIENGSAEIVMPDLIWTGGISETKKIATLADTYQTPIAPHDWTGPINVFACAHISMNCQNVMLQETNRAYYKGWYDKFIEPNIIVKDGYLLAPEGPGLGTQLKKSVFERSDVHIEESTEPYEWEPVGFRDPDQKISHFFSPNLPKDE